MLAVALLLLQSTAILGQERNVYDKPMTNCGPNHATGCTYVAQDAGAHEVCVTQLPQGFSTETGQGPWSDQFAGQPWCICIWAYSNYILQNKNLALKCESIPSTVLQEQYSLDKFAQCGSMSSTTGCGAEDIRRSIQSLCQQCDAQAVDPTSKMVLKAKCDNILAAAPAAPMSRLFAQDGSMETDRKGFLKTTLGLNSVLAVSGVVLAAVLMGMAFSTFRRRNSHGNQRMMGDENPETDAEAVE